MQQRQPRLGDILDDYCPRERRLTNHAVVAMIGDDIRLTRCGTCDAEHDYKHARVPRVRKKSDPAVIPRIGIPVPKRIVPGSPGAIEMMVAPPADAAARELPASHEVRAAHHNLVDQVFNDPPPSGIEGIEIEEGPAHRPLIRAQLPRVDGQPAMPRQPTEFTIRQPVGRPNRLRGREDRGNGFSGGFGGGASHNGNDRGNRSTGQAFGGSGSGSGSGGHGRGTGPRPSGRPPISGRATQRQNDGRRRSK